MATSDSSKKKSKKTKKASTRRRGVLDLPKAVEQRLAEGRAQRDAVPLEAHAEWSAPASRQDPVAILEG